MAGLPARKTRHREEREDGAGPAWALGVTPWVAFAFAVVQIEELIVMRKTHTRAEVQPLQVTRGIMGNNTRDVIKRVLFMRVLGFVFHAFIRRSEVSV